MSEAATYGEELNQYNYDVEGVKQENLLEQLQKAPDDFVKLITAEVGLPIGIEGTKHGLVQFYKSSGLQKKVQLKTAELKTRVANFLKPYGDRLQVGIDNLKGYLNNGLAGLRDKAQAFVDDSLTGLRGSVTGAVRDQLDSVQSQFEQLKSDLGGKYQDALGQLEDLKRRGIAEGNSQYKAALDRANSLKGELEGRLQDLQSRAQETLANARDQIEQKARSVGDQLKGQADAVISQGKSRLAEAQSRLADAQVEAAQGLEGAQARLSEAQEGLRQAAQDRISSLQSLSPEVLQSVQESARAEYLQAQDKLSQLTPDDGQDYESALQEVQSSQQKLSSAVQDFADRAQSIQGLGRDALEARRTSAMAEVESARNALSSEALSGAGEDVAGVLKSAQDRLIQAQTNLRGTLVDLGEEVPDALGSLRTAGSYFLRGAEGVGSDLFGALPALALDLGSGASLATTGKDTGIAAAANRGIGTVGDIFNAAKAKVTGIADRYRGLTPRQPVAGSEGATNTEGGVVEDLGGDFDALAGDTMGAVKSISSEFVRTGRPTGGFLQNLFGDVTSKTRGLISDVQEAGRGLVDNVQSAGRAALSEAQDFGRAALTEAQSIGQGLSQDAQNIGRQTLSDVAASARAAASNVASGARLAANDLASSAGAAARGSLADLQAQASQASARAGNFLASQSSHPVLPQGSSNIARATEVGAQEGENIASISKLAGVDSDVAASALESGASAIQGGVLEGGLGEAAIGSVGAAAGEAAGAGAAAEAAGEGIEAATGDTGIGAILGGLAILGGVLYDLFGTHDEKPPVIPLPNYSIPVFAPGGH